MLNENSVAPTDVAIITSLEDGYTRLRGLQFTWAQVLWDTVNTMGTSWHRDEYPRIRELVHIRSGGA